MGVAFFRLMTKKAAYQAAFFVILKVLRRGVVFPFVHSHNFPNFSTFVTVFLGFFRSVFDLPKWMFSVVNQFGQMSVRFYHNLLYFFG